MDDIAPFAFDDDDTQNDAVESDPTTPDLGIKASEDEAVAGTGVAEEGFPSPVYPPRSPHPYSRGYPEDFFRNQYDGSPVPTEMDAENNHSAEDSPLAPTEICQWGAAVGTCEVNTASPPPALASPPEESASPPREHSIASTPKQTKRKQPKTGKVSTREPKAKCKAKAKANARASAKCKARASPKAKSKAAKSKAQASPKTKCKAKAAKPKAKSAPKKDPVQAKMHSAIQLNLVLVSNISFLMHKRIQF